MNIVHLKYAVEIARTKSISKAAENLYMAQPNLSRAVKELEEALGNGERSMEVLLHVVDEHPNAPQCALRLADMQMDRGMFGEVIKTCNYGLSASCEVQPSINIPYLILLRTLCKDALLFKRMHQGMHVTADEIDMLVKEYEFIRAEFPELSHYSAITRIRANCLKLQKLSCA